MCKLRFNLQLCTSGDPIIRKKEENNLLSRVFLCGYH